MDNKIFFIVFKNKVLFNLIYSKVHHIHRYILLNSDENIYKWDQLLDNLYLLSYYNYLNEIKQHHNNRIKNNEHNNNSIFNKLPLRFISDKLMDYIARGDSLDVLQYFINQRPDLIKIKSIFVLSVKYNSLKIFNYLESLTNNNNNSNKKSKTSTISSPSSSLSTKNEIEWDYYHAISVVPVSGNMVLFLDFIDKVDIRGTLLNNSKTSKYDNDEYMHIIRFIEASAEYGRTEILDHIFGLFESDKYLLEDILINDIPSIFDIIIKSGNLDIFKQCFNHNNISIQNKLNHIDLLIKCIDYKKFEMMKYFHENKIGGNSYGAIDKAAYIGNLEIIKWLHENRTERCSTKSIDNAARFGHFEIIKWLHHNRTEGCTTDSMDKVARFGHLEIVKWLHENRTEGCTTNAMDYAAENGHLEIIKWLHENRTEGCTTKAMNYASSHGHLETIKWLHHNRTEGCTTDAMNYAAWISHFEMIKWLHENRSEGCTTHAMNFASKNGNLEIVIWLHLNRSEGCTTNAMDDAAKNGHIEMIKWLHENRTEGCTTNAIPYAKHNNHLEIVQWLQENRTEA